MQVRVVGNPIFGSTWEDGTAHSSPMVAVLQDSLSHSRGDSVIPLVEIRNAKVVVEQDRSRVRFVLQGREIVFDPSGFQVQPTPADPPESR